MQPSGEVHHPYADATAVGPTTLAFPKGFTPPVFPLGTGRILYRTPQVLIAFHGSHGFLEDSFTISWTGIDPRERHWHGFDRTPPWQDMLLVLGNGFYFQNTSGETWSYHPSVFPVHGPEGINKRGDERYWVKDANEGALVGVSPVYQENNTWYWWAYSKEIDRSQGGGKYYYFSDYPPQRNILDFWLEINDTFNGYWDNNGFMNATMTIFRIGS
jgi:hypothetical protein